MDKSVKITVIAAAVAIVLAVGIMALVRGSSGSTAPVVNDAAAAANLPGAASPANGGTAAPSPGPSSASGGTVSAPGSAANSSGGAASGSKGTGVSPEQQKFVEDELKK